MLFSNSQFLDLLSGDSTREPIGFRSLCSYYSDLNYRRSFEFVAVIGHRLRIQYFLLDDSCLLDSRTPQRFYDPVGSFELRS